LQHRLSALEQERDALAGSWAPSACPILVGPLPLLPRCASQKPGGKEHMAESSISAYTDECRAQTAADELAVTVTLKTKAERDAGSVPALLDEISALVMLCTASLSSCASCASGSYG
jgi:hypothetical protein